MNSYSKNFAVVLAIGLLVGSGAFAEDKKETDAEKETRQAAAETQAEQDTGEAGELAATKTFTGKLKMGPPEGEDNPNPDVVGMLVIDTGEIYQLKLDRADLLQKLQGFDRKKV